MKNIKNKILTIAPIVFFLIINTSYFWIDKIGFWAMLISLLFIIIYFIFVAVFISQLYFVVKEKFKNKFRVFNMGLLAIVLILTRLFPTGMINFEKFEGKNLLIIGNEGAGNCHSTIKFKEDLTFIKRDVCFKMEKTKGTYRISNDTIYFLKGKEDLEYEFAIIKELKSNKYSIQFFRDKNDTIGNYNYYDVYKNDLKINYKK